MFNLWKKKILLHVKIVNVKNWFVYFDNLSLYLYKVSKIIFKTALTELIFKNVYVITKFNMKTTDFVYKFNLYSN